MPNLGQAADHPAATPAPAPQASAPNPVAVKPVAPIPVAPKPAASSPAAAKPATIKPTAVNSAVPKPMAAMPRPTETRPARKHAPRDARDSRHGDVVHWSYEGENGPQAWGKLKSDFSVCAIGKRQSPIDIDDASTLQGPAEPLQFNYQPSTASVVNNGHTIQVDIAGDNSLVVRNSVYKLLQFHFHLPSEERINHQSFAMVAHLVHKNVEGQLAVVAVLLDPGVRNALINKVWTNMPLDTDDRVRIPEGIMDVNELLPRDRRYYQFMGSLTTPPCTEGVLWLVLKQPTTMSPEQINLFSQVFPGNARPVQPQNGRVVRGAQ